LSESPIITFVRGITLLVILIALPGIAICWNHLPKNLWRESTPRLAAPKTEKTQYFRTDANNTDVAESAEFAFVFVPESTSVALPEEHAEVREEAVSTLPPPNPLYWEPHDTAIQHVSWEQNPVEVPQDFETLFLRLKTLGVTYYKLEKWGNQGTLYRFSCCVASSETYSYEKHFQSIGTDAVTVTQRVIADVEKWKNVR